MSCEETLITTNNHSDYGTGESTRRLSVGYMPRMVFATHGPTGGLSKLSCIFFFACSRYVTLTGFTDLPARSFEANDRLNILSSWIGDFRVTIVEGANCKCEDRECLKRPLRKVESVWGWLVVDAARPRE